LTGDLGEHSDDADTDAFAELPVRFRDRRPTTVGAPAWEREAAGERFRSRFALWHRDDGWLLDVDCEGRGSFLLADDRVEVCWQGGTGPAHYLQTIGLALWLELHGVLCLHANGLEIQGAGIGVMAPSQTGKTTLTAALLDRGWRLMTDDMLAIRKAEGGWRCYASAPALRLWPATGPWFGGTAFDAAPPVHARFAKRELTVDAGRRCTGSRPLRRLYVLDRREAAAGEVRIDALASAEGLVECLRQSIVGDAAGALGIAPQRLARLADLVGEVGVRRLSYPSGREHLEDIARRLEADAQQ
jgi:hypothetical protein